MIQSRDFKEFIKLLNSKKVKYMIIGGYAVAYHGYPRYTGDIDFWIDNSRENARRIIAVLNDFGFDSLEIKPDDLANPDNVIQLGFPPNRIDLICGIEGIDYNNAYDNSEITEIDGEKIRFINLDDLITTKSISARKQDLADIDKLEKIRLMRKNLNGKS